MRSGVESAASMPIALQRTCHVFPLPVGRSRVASFVEVYAPSNRPQPLGDSRNAGASLAERLLGGPAGSAEKRVLRAGKRQGLDVAARPTLPSTRRCAWMAPGRGIEGHENDVAALGVGRNDGASADSHRLCRDATDLNQSNISCLVELGLKVKK